MKELTFALFTFLFLTGVCYAEPSKYAEAKTELVNALKDSESNFDPRGLSGKTWAKMESLKSTNKGKSVIAKDLKFVHSKCTAFFDEANTFSEKILFQMCSRWGWFPSLTASF